MRSSAFQFLLRHYVSEREDSYVLYEKLLLGDITKHLLQKDIRRKTVFLFNVT